MAYLIKFFVFMQWVTPGVIFDAEKIQNGCIYASFIWKIYICKACIRKSLAHLMILVYLCQNNFYLGVYGKKSLFKSIGTFPNGYRW